MKKYALQISILAGFLLVFLCFGCGARKVEKTKTEEIEKTDTSNISVSKSKDSTTISDGSKIITKEKTYEPVDATKSASVITPDGKKHVLNNAKFHTKETTENKDVKSLIVETSIQIEKATSHSDTSKKTDVKTIDKKPWSLWNLLWLLIPVVIYFEWKNWSIFNIKK